jgi:hypothetical protein
MGRPRKSPVRSSVASGSGRPMEELQEEMNEKLSALMEEVKSLSADLRTVKRENEQLRQTINNQEDVIADLRNEMNDRELHARSWSIRALNIPIPPGKETDNGAVMAAVYRELVVPILEGAKASGEITAVPPCHSVIEIAHILPGKGGKKPIIIRFLSRYWRSLLFKYRKDFAPRDGAAPSSATPPAGAAADSRRPRMCYPFYEDLTRATFKQLMSIQQHERVVSAWTVSGVVRFKIQNSETVYKVSSIYDKVEDFIQ